MQIFVKTFLFLETYHLLTNKNYIKDRYTEIKSYFEGWCEGLSLVKNNLFD
jgi:hypothetical protein